MGTRAFLSRFPRAIRTPFPSPKLSYTPLDSTYRSPLVLGFRRGGSTMPKSVVLRIVTPEDSEIQVEAIPGEFLLQTIERADVSDFWQGGACGGACNCSTCRVLFDKDIFTLLHTQEDDEIDMLESAAQQEGDAESQNLFLDNARLACQVEVIPEMDGCFVYLPEDSHNMMEIPLWMRER